MRRIGAYVAIVVVVLMAGAAVWLYFAGYLDRGKPGITLKEEISAIGRKKDIGLSLSDAASGLARIKVEIVQDNQARLIAAESFPRGVRQKDLRVSIDTDALKLKNGPAILSITAYDHSLFKNEAVWSQQIKIDTLPPQIAVLNPVNYLNQGGTGFIAYRISKPASLTGVYVDQRFFKGHTLMLGGRPTTVAYFAVPCDAAGSKTRIAVFARDAAGNEAQTSLPFTIKPKKFRSDKVDLSHSFLQKIVPDFQASTPQLSGKTPVEVFAYVNSTLRDENTRTIQSVCARTAPSRLWDGAFHRMRNAKPMALFGDQRTYMVDGKPFGNSVHLGIDLASVAHAPIEAANAGVVVFAGPLGIYGNAVIIDHGLGLFSLYGHLSAIETTVGKSVRKEEKLGLSGLTGLAGGDHLHFSILVGGAFVNPQEWWDPHWIEDNVMKKMQI
ncbi:MAG: M23 family metallopeptidase [Deltaproteobacteria bacterium]|jgi:murein DD-endopeptidase MepM/ murein hydrolase activator NlpD|nr:M23 family metallopeptidase [Syntrophaceae bacterium]